MTTDDHGPSRRDRPAGARADDPLADDLDDDDLDDDLDDPDLEDEDEAPREARTPEEIQREIERTRADMDQTLDAIQSRFSQGNVIEQALGYLRGGPAEFGTNLARAVQANPVPVALVALGIGWLLVSSARDAGGRGSGWRDRERRAYEDYAVDDGYSDYDADDYGAEDYGYDAVDDDSAAVHNAGGYGAYGTGAGGYAGTGAGGYRRGYASEPETAPMSAMGEHRRGAPSGGRSWVGRLLGRAASWTSDWNERVDHMTDSTQDNAGTQSGGGIVDTARRKLGDIAETGRDTLHSAQDAVSGGLHSAQDAVAGTLHGARDYAGNLGSAAREGISRVGNYAQSVGSYAQSQVDWSRRRFDRAIDEQPLLLGVLGLAVGALIGFALPTTRRENELMGPVRDTLRHRAEDAGREELRRAKRVAKRTIDSVKDEATDLAKFAGEDLARKTGDAAREAADDEKLGGSLSGSSKS